MTARIKPKAKPAAKPVDAPVVVSATGVELVDGAPYFATVDGARMNRRQWLAATRDDRTKDLVEELRGTARP